MQDCHHSIGVCQRQIRLIVRRCVGQASSDQKPWIPSLGKSQSLLWSALNLLSEQLNQDAILKVNLLGRAQIWQSLSSWSLSQIWSEADLSICPPYITIYLHTTCINLDKADSHFATSLAMPYFSRYFRSIGFVMAPSFKLPFTMLPSLKRMSVGSPYTWGARSLESISFSFVFALEKVVEKIDTVSKIPYRGVANSASILARAL